MSFDPGLFLVTAGLFLAAAVVLLRCGQLAYAWLGDQWMGKDLMSRQWKARHRGRPALVARADVHEGATVDWSPTGELAAAAEREPEELPAEAVVREAEEIVDHWAAEEARFETEVRAWFDELVQDDPIAAMLLTEERERLARKASVDAADAASVPTGEWPIVRTGVTA